MRGLKLQILLSFLLATLGLFLLPTQALAVMQSLDGISTQNQTFTDDSNVTMTPSGSAHVLGWSGQLPVSRGGTGASSFTAGSVLFSNGTSILEDNANLFWDNANNRLGIGTTSPTSPLEVSGNAKVTSLTSTADSTIHSLNIGLGGGSVASNTALGNQTLQNNTGGERNTAVGQRALFSTQSSDNTAVGQMALGGSSNTGEQNTSVGSQTLQANTTGSYNAAYGYKALQFNTTGIFNVGLGLAALNFNTIGDGNVAIGVGALQNNTTGSNNVAIGRDANQSAVSDSNSIVIGHGAVGAGSFKTVIGNSSMQDVYFGSSSANANIHAKKLFLGSSSVPGCIIMGDTSGGIGYVTLVNGALTVSSTPPTACQ